MDTEAAETSQEHEPGENPQDGKIGKEEVNKMDLRAPLIVLNDKA